MLPKSHRERPSQRDEAAALSAWRHSWAVQVTAWLMSQLAVELQLAVTPMKLQQIVDAYHDGPAQRSPADTPSRRQIWRGARIKHAGRWMKKGKDAQRLVLRPTV